jgi:hypothetical protein
VFTAGCKRESGLWVERLEVGANALAAPRSGPPLPRSELEPLLKDALVGAGFQLLSPDTRDAPKGALRVRLDVRPSLDDAEPSDEPEGQVAVLRVARHLAGTKPGKSRARTAWEAESFSFQRPQLKDALEQVAAKARALLEAEEKSDEALVKELYGEDGPARRGALQVLADRKHPSAVEPLIALLHDEDLGQARRAVGALVEMKEHRAVGPIIELCDSRDPSFMKELLYALSALGGDEAKAYLYTVAQGHDSASVRTAAQQALDELTRSEHKQSSTAQGANP